MSSYNKIQFIAYEIDSAPKDALFIDGRLVAGTYLGLDDISEDIAQRCRLMLDAISAAASDSHISQDPSTLKVFMAPEFFFRGPNGAYTMDQVQEVISTLQENVKGDIWAGWMFVFGTIVGYSEITNEELLALLSSTYKKPEQDFYEIYNFVLVQQGGYTSVQDAEALARVVMKENMSGIDFMVYPTTGIDLRTAQHLPPLSPPAPGREVQVMNYDGLGIFQMAGLTFGAEICLDHLTGRLDASPASPGDPMVQVQLVPSCGASLVEKYIVAQDDGYAFNVDGITPPSSTARKVSSVLPLASTTAPVNPSLLSPPVDVDELYADGPGNVRIYTPAVIPVQEYKQGNVTRIRVEDDDVVFDFAIWYDDAGKFDRVYCSCYFTDMEAMIDTICLPVVGTIGDEVSMNAEVRSVVDPSTKDDMGVWMDLDMTGYSIEGIVVTFPSTYAG